MHTHTNTHLIGVRIIELQRSFKLLFLRWEKERPPAAEAVRSRADTGASPLLGPGVTEPSGRVRFYFKRQQAASDWQGRAGKEDMKECVIGAAGTQVSLTEANWNKATDLMRSDECAAAPTSVRLALTKPSCRTKTVVWGRVPDKVESSQTRAVPRLINRLRVTPAPLCVYIVACFVAIKWTSVCMSGKQPVDPRCVLVPSKPVGGELWSTTGREHTKVDVRLPDLGGWWGEPALIHLILLCILNWTCAAFVLWVGSFPYSTFTTPPLPYFLLWSLSGSGFFM